MPAWINLIGTKDSALHHVFIPFYKSNELNEYYYLKADLKYAI